MRSTKTYKIFCIRSKLVKEFSRIKTCLLIWHWIKFIIRTSTSIAFKVLGPWACFSQAIWILTNFYNQVQIWTNNLNSNKILLPKQLKTSQQLLRSQLRYIHLAVKGALRKTPNLLQKLIMTPPQTCNTKAAPSNTKGNLKIQTKTKASLRTLKFQR